MTASPVKKRILFLSFCLALGVWAYAERPNIVLVMADDVGPGDIAFYHRERTGNAEVIPTPNLDRLIAQGMRFDDAHSPAPLCAPTRFGMMTGSYSYRNYRPFRVCFGDSAWDPTLAGPMLADKAKTYIATQVRENPGRPFFLYYCSQAVHIPHAPPDTMDGEAIADTTPSPQFDMVRELDVQIEVLIDALEAAGVYENTLFHRFQSSLVNPTVS